ncbi:cerebellin-1-like [Ruditapes philippinarum]|uniref:cerebellin-1-like n=1 Tax=Ruditapes philippinarum TaxID=129788 RepID=UPI00295B3D54|nr:cerebellin-1-like [Ruditapes philippinarum]
MRKMVRILCVVTVLMIALDHAFAEAQVDLRLEISHLASQLKMLTQRVQQDEEMLRQCRDQEEKVSSLQRNVDQLKWQLRNVTALEDVIEKVRWSKNKISTPNRRFARSSDPTEVAFTAMLNTELNDVPIHTTVIFDFLIYDTGTNYDDSTGVFTSPTSGLYLFSVFIETHSVNTEALVNLMKEGQPYMFVASDRGNDVEDNTGGNVCLLTVNKGERVWVKTILHDKQSFWIGFTTFSGVLIHPH